jgi:hypothetical protein
MAYTFVPRSGKFAKVRVGGAATILTSKKWTATPRAAESDTTNFETVGQEDVETNVIGLDITIDFDWDSALGGTPYDSPLTLTPGTNVSLKLYINDTSGPFWNIPTAKVLQTPVTGEPKAMIGGTVTFKAKPGWSYPTGGF